MATPAQCYYCFECLSASFQGNEPPNLSVIEDLWEEFEASKDLALEAEPKKVTDAALAEKNLAGKGPATKPNAVDVDESDQDTQNDAMDDSEDGQKTRDLPETLQPPSIRRLQGVSSSRSSSSSEPSALSTSSSRSVLTSASSMTSAASSKSSSIFSSSKSYSENLRSETTYPLFVTWNTVSRSGQKSLRGCIGTFEPQALAPGLKSYALTSYVFLLFPGVIFLSRDFMSFCTHDLSRFANYQEEPSVILDSLQYQQALCPRYLVLSPFYRRSRIALTQWTGS